VLPECAPGTDHRGRLLFVKAQRVSDGGVREWAWLAMLDAIDFSEELGMMSQ
jgi:hypothetical protein